MPSTVFDVTSDKTKLSRQ